METNRVINAFAIQPGGTRCGIIFHLEESVGLVANKLDFGFNSSQEIEEIGLKKIGLKPFLYQFLDDKGNKIARFDYSASGFASRQFQNIDPGTVVVEFFGENEQGPEVNMTIDRITEAAKRENMEVRFHIKAANL